MQQNAPLPVSQYQVDTSNYLQYEWLFLLSKPYLAYKVVKETKPTSYEELLLVITRGQPQK